MEMDTIERVRKTLEKEYLLIKKGKWWSFLGGLVGFLVVAGFVSYQATLKAVETTGARAAIQSIEALKEQAEKDVDQIHNMRRQSSDTFNEIARISQDLQKIPIGTIIPSMLNPNSFAATVGDPPVFDPEKSKWVLADKQKDISKSLYGKLLNNTRYTPDLRGMFLRGMNEGRNDGWEDPDANRRAGDEQNDMLEKHQHKRNAVWADANSPKDRWVKNGEYFAYNFVDSPPTGPYGGVETRPKNVAVYFYIKIN